MITDGVSKTIGIVEETLVAPETSKWPPPYRQRPVRSVFLLSPYTLDCPFDKPRNSPRI